MTYDAFFIEVCQKFLLLIIQETKVTFIVFGSVLSSEFWVCPLRTLNTSVPSLFISCLHLFAFPFQSLCALSRFFHGAFLLFTYFFIFALMKTTFRGAEFRIGVLFCPSIQVACDVVSCQVGTKEVSATCTCECEFPATFIYWLLLIYFCIMSGTCFICGIKPATTAKISSLNVQGSNVYVPILENLNRAFFIRLLLHTLYWICPQAHRAFFWWEWLFMKQSHSLFGALFRCPKKRWPIQWMHIVGCMWCCRDRDCTISFAEFFNMDGFVAAAII